MFEPGNQSKLTCEPNELAVLFAGLEVLETGAIVLDASGLIRYITSTAAQLLGWAASQVVGQSWQPRWLSICPDGPLLTATPQRLTLDCAERSIQVRIWQRSLTGGAGIVYTLIKLEDTSLEDEHEAETMRIFQDLQAQADDLFALYQISQFLNSTQELDQLCSTLLKELVQITSADLACLYLVTPHNLQPQVWHGLTTNPALQAEAETAYKWFQTQVQGREILQLPLLADDQLAGLALLAYQGPPRRDLRFLQTVANEMGTALRAMAGRQALMVQEQKLEAIVAGTTDAIIQVTQEQRILDFNPAATQLLGYNSTEVLTRSCAEVLGCAESSGCGGSCLFAQVLFSHEPIPYTELTVTGRKGPRQVAASVAALALENEAAPAAVAILRDVTRQKQIEQMKTDFTAMVSHELRTPLALLRGYSDTLLHLELTPQEQLKYLKGIATTTNQLERLVAQILDVSRIEAGRIELERELVRLPDIIRRAIEALPASAGRSRIQIELPGPLPLLYADPPRLEQVLTNLLNNALKYSRQNEPVSIRAEQSGPELMVQVLDRGIGVPAQEQESMFNKFQRASNARQLQLPGTGLGLFICRNLIEAHGGRIKLNDRPGSGTCITFWIPITQEQN